MPGAGAGCGRPARCGGIAAGRTLSSPSAPHEAALRRPTGDLASLPARDGVRLDKAASNRWSGGGDPASQVCIRRGHRFARPAVRPGAGSPLALVHAASPTAGTAAQRDQPQCTAASGGLSPAVGIGAIVRRGGLHSANPLYALLSVALCEIGILIGQGRRSVCGLLDRSERINKEKGFCALLGELFDAIL